MVISEDQERAVQEAVAELLPPRTVLGDSPKLDVSKPNFHDSKAEFRREVEAVETARQALHTALLALNPKIQPQDEETAELRRRLQRAIDQSARRNLRLPFPDSIIDLVRKNKADTGYFFHFLWGLLDMMEFLDERRNELADQERQYWSKKHRAPNYYARAIALRLARLYAHEKGERPTFGTARDGGHPSTAYGRALEKIFEALEIKGGVKRPAKWAIDQLTEEDVAPRRTKGILAALMDTDVHPERSGNALGSLLGGFEGLGSNRNALAYWADEAKKGSPK